MLVVGMAVAVSLPSAQDTASQLETIKAEVLSAALADGVSVVSSAYINGDGQLVESSFIAPAAVSAAFGCKRCSTSKTRVFTRDT